MILTLKLSTAYANCLTGHLGLWTSLRRIYPSVWVWEFVAWGISLVDTSSSLFNCAYANCQLSLWAFLRRVYPSVWVWAQGSKMEYRYHGSTAIICNLSVASIGWLQRRMFISVVSDYTNFLSERENEEPLTCCMWNQSIGYHHHGEPVQCV